MKQPRPLFILSITILVVIAGVFLLNFSETDQGGNANYQKHIVNNYKIYSLHVPEVLEVFGETVPLHIQEVKERYDRELLVNAYWQSQTMLFIKRSNKWFPLIEKILKDNNIPDDFKYLALIESGFLNASSSAGAKGFWQFMESSGKEYGLEINTFIDERNHIEKATLAACKYLKGAYAKLGSWTLAAASYNMGVGGINNQMQKQKVDNYYDLYLNTETSRYVFRILAIKEILCTPENFGFHIRDQDKYLPENFQEIQVDSSIPDLIVFAHQNNVLYKDIKRLNPWILSDQLPNKSKKTYTIKLPI
jgi:membrane-bound lytic murein transglycosylase D